MYMIRYGVVKDKSVDPKKEQTTETAPQDDVKGREDEKTTEIKETEK
jgi:hypothetical protein